MFATVHSGEIFLYKIIPIAVLWCNTAVSGQGVKRYSGDSSSLQANPALRTGSNIIVTCCGEYFDQDMIDSFINAYDECADITRPYADSSITQMD